LIYLLAYEDMAAHQKAWDQFWLDPEWTSGRATLAEKFGGPVVIKSNSVLLKPTDYSALR
jgi:hypothetical protein